MSHILRPSEIYGGQVGLQRAVVKVKRDGDNLVVEGFAGVSLRDTNFVRVPERITVRGEGWKIIRPSKGSRFWISTNTFDPYHILCELPDS